MRLSVFLGAVVAVLLLGAATVYGAVVLDDNLTVDPNSIEVLVATEDIPACTGIEALQSSIERERMQAADTPAGALVTTDFFAGQVLARDVEAGDVIKAQMFTKDSCVVPAG